jgi:hypothetical protein
MKLLPPPVIRCATAMLAFILLMSLSARAYGGEIKFEAILIWGTNNEKSPDPKLKPVGPKLEAKLKKLPFKWEHYFEVNRETFSIPDGQTKKVKMSEDCDIKVHRLDAEKVEVQLFGKKKLVGNISQKLPKGECLLTGGNATNSTGWFVVLRQID